MKALLFCFSSTGNTRLVSEYVCSRLERRGIETRLVDIRLSRKAVDLVGFDLVGFSFPVWAWGPPYPVLDLLESLPGQDQKPAFFLATYGGIRGATDYIFWKALREKGFRVIGRHGVQAPASEPVVRRFLSPALPVIDSHPDRRHRKKLDSFADELAGMRGGVGVRMGPAEVKVRNNFYNPCSLIGQLFDREELPSKIGIPSLVERSSCNLCGKCVDVCTTGRLTMADGEVRFAGKCAACFSCYNHCPTGAISARHTRGKQYRGPSSRFRELFRAAG